MISPTAFEEIFRMEQELLDQRNLRRARWHEREPRAPAANLARSTRRRLARALLLIADRLDPRVVVGVPHVPTPPGLNGTLHHA